MASSESRVSSIWGSAAPTNATGRSSRRDTCWRTEPNSRISSKSPLCISSMVINRPVSRSASASPSPDSAPRRSYSALGVGTVSNSTPIPAALRLLKRRLGSAGPISARRSDAARVRRSGSPADEALSDSASHPRLRARSSTALSITVLPAPRTPMNRAV